MRATKFICVCLALLSTQIWLQSAFAQTPDTINPQFEARDENSTSVYEAAYFDKFAPRTAADMVAQIPRFTLSETDDKRGFGQGGVNVLINGVRLTGKNNDATLALSRIPAASVLKIELLDGAGLDIPGLSGNVVNIITGEDDFSASWKYRAEWQKGSRANLFGLEAAISGNRGPLEYNIGFNSAPLRQTETGPELIANASGQIVETRDELATLFEDNPQISGELTFSPSNGHVGHLNVSYQQVNLIQEDRSLQTAVTIGGENGERLDNFGIDSWNGEIGADYAFDLGKGNLKLIAITRRDDSDLSDVFRTVSSNGNDTTEIFTQSTQAGETIARAEYSVQQDKDRDWQIAAEGAFNFLETDSTLVEGPTNGVLTPILIPGGSSRVEERRAEASVTHNWKSSEKLSLQATAGIEYSELSQTGPSGLTRDFVRPKGLVSASYAASDNFIVRAKVERSVGQLDFDTFISSVDPANDLESAANPEIVPSQSWDGEIEVEKTWDNGVSGTLRVYGQRFEDVVDRIRLDDGRDAPGNIDSATAFGVEMIGTVKFDNFGVKGAQLDVELEARDSTVEDPLSGVDRWFSASLVSRYQVDFRHDIDGTEWAWGLSAENYREAREFRLTQISHFTQTQPALEVFIERKNVLGLTIRADVRDTLQSDFNFTRYLFDGNNRVDGNFIGSETRVRNNNRFYGISVSGSF